jgi:hypothetical protein
MLDSGFSVEGAPPSMNLQMARVWEISAGATVIAGAAALGAWLVFRRRPTPEELELARRLFLTQSGRLVDGTLLEVCEVEGEDGRTLTMLMYDYLIGGVDYQCSQDITNMGAIVDPAQVRPGLPCSVRYQPGNPQNSIVIAEKWSGLRTKLPAFPAHQPSAAESRHLNGKADISGHA